MIKVMISVGEASGDLHGASIANSIKSLKPEARVFGMGGDAMRAAGVEIVVDIASQGIFGLVEIFNKLPRLYRIRRTMAELMDREQPDVLVLIDYGGFNIPLAKIAKSKSIPAIYYIPPKVWAWGRGRAKTIAENVDLVAAIFPFEIGVYQSAGAKVTYVGNPLIDIVKASGSKEEAYRTFGADPAKPLVLLMPGSRKQEVVNILPSMLAAAGKIVEKYPNSQFYLPVASTISREILQKALNGSPVSVRLTSENTYDLMQIADVAIAASGTATLETALMGVPTVIVYKVAAITYFLGKMLVKIPYFGLPNIIAGHMVFPELIQGKATPNNIAREALAFLTDSGLRNHVLQELGNIRRSLGEGGAVEKVAELILKMAVSKRGGIK